jgi:hypothetical protein
MRAGSEGEATYSWLCKGNAGAAYIVASVEIHKMMRSHCLNLSDLNLIISTEQL